MSSYWRPKLAEELEKKVNYLNVLIKIEQVHMTRQRYQKLKIWYVVLIFIGKHVCPFRKKAVMDILNSKSSAVTCWLKMNSNLGLLKLGRTMIGHFFLSGVYLERKFLENVTMTWNIPEGNIILALRSRLVLLDRKVAQSGKRKTNRHQRRSSQPFPIGHYSWPTRRHCRSTRCPSAVRLLQLPQAERSLSFGSSATISPYIAIFFPLPT